MIFYRILSENYTTQYSANLVLTIAFSILSIFLNAQTPVCGFTYKKIITIQGSRVVGGPHTDFPLLISHTDPDLAQAAGKVTSSFGYDIVFADDSGNLLDFQLEKYNGTSGQYVAWVRIPSLTNGVNLDIHMLYGKPSITSDQSSTAVWGTNYQAVWHLNDDFLDHTSTNFNGVNNGSVDIPAKIADGQSFTAPNHWIELPTFPNLTSNFTISGWAYTTNNTRAGQRIFADDANNTGGYSMSIGDPGTGSIRFYSRASNPVSLDSPGGTILNNTWHYCVAVADISGNIKRLYVDGVQVASGAFTNSWGTDAGNASIGGEVASGESANRFQGNLDEIRIANSALSANWITTEYRSQNQPILSFGSASPGDFYVVASEEDIFHTSAGSGDWDQTSTWDSGEIPDGQYENVVIGNHEVDIDGGSGNYTVCDCTLNGTGASHTRLDVSSNRVLTVAGNLDANHTGSGGNNNTRLLVTGTAVVNVLVDMVWESSNTNSGSDIQLLMRNSGTLNLDGDFIGTKSAGDDFLIDQDASSQVNINGNLQINHNGGDLITIDVEDASILEVTGDFIVDKPAGNGIIIRINNASGVDGRINIAGNVNINRSGGDDVEILVDEDNSLFTIGQDFNFVSTGGGAFDLDINNDGTFQVDGSFDLEYLSASAGGINLEAAPSSPTFNVEGNIDLTHAGGGGHFLLDLNGGTFSTTLDLNMINANVVAAGDLDLELDGDATALVGGDLTANLMGGDDIWFDLGTLVGGSTAQMIVSGNATFIQNQTGAGHLVRLFVFENTRFEVQGNLTWTNSMANDLMLLNLQNSGQITVHNDINLNAQSDGDIEIRLEDNSELQIGGNFARQAVPNNYGLLNSDLTATVEYNGSVAQLFAEDAGAGSDGFNYGIVEINNSSGTSPQVTMEGLATVNGGIIFMDGVIASNATDLLVIANGASTSGASDASHVDGFVRKTGNTPAGEFTGNGYAFPVGDDDNYQPIYITAPASGSDQFDAQYFEENPHPTYDNTSKDASIEHISGVEYWLLETPGSPSVSVRLSWDFNSGGVGNLGDLVVARWDGSTWIDEGNGGTTGNTTAGTVVSAGAISSFSPFTLGTTSLQNALPIVLQSFRAMVIDNSVDLKWVTASETNNDFFTIERSRDTREWEELLEVQGAGNSTVRLNYHETDRDPYIGTSYYRLKQTDFDGTFSYSHIERVLVTETDVLSVRPIPSPGQVSVVSGKGIEPAQVVVYNYLGQQVYPLIKQVTSRELSLDFTSLKQGAYFINVITPLGSTNLRVLITY